MIEYQARDISRAVAAICPDIQSQVRTNLKPTDRVFWWELSACILSSQVPYVTAVEAANSIDKQGILFESRADDSTTFERLYSVLLNPFVINGQMRRYRFPEIRARQLSAAHKIFNDMKKRSPISLFNEFDDVTTARMWLVDYIPGLGPKQASMFLRNIGFSYDLAILDSHVLNYMRSIGIYSEEARSISGLRKYDRYEAVLRDHAKELDCPVGILDWAIWVVMRVVNRKYEALEV